MKLNNSKKMNKTAPALDEGENEEETLSVIDPENWMKNLPQKLKTLPLIHLAIPGSHDSTTYGITRNSEIAPDAETIVQKLKFLGPILRTIMVRWSVTQTLDISAQLGNGIRYFDLRIATKEGTDNLHFVHGLYSIDVAEALEKFKQYLDTHPNEVIILDFQHFYAFQPRDHQQLMCLLANTFSHRMLPFSPHMEHATLEYLTVQFRYQVVTIYRSDAARFGQPLLWPASTFPTPWPNTLSVGDLKNALDIGLKLRNYAIGHVSQFLLTPTTWFVCKNLFSNLRAKCALKINGEKYRWLRSKKAGRNGGVNVVISDFVEADMARFAKEVILMNYRLLQEQ